MKKIIKKALSIPLQFWAKMYFRKPRNYRYKNIRGVILPTVFFPQLTISTKLLLEYLENQELSGKSFLELGCGTGFISVLAAIKGAKVCASDINPVAIKNVRLNATKNQVYVNGIESDLFEKIPKLIFDWIIINPPYYPRNPINEAEKAWFCGEKFEYFESLFKDLGAYFSKESKVLMILSEDCEIDSIESIALKNDLAFSAIQRKKRRGELNYIFRIQNVSKSPSVN